MFNPVTSAARLVLALALAAGAAPVCSAAEQSANAETAAPAEGSLFRPLLGSQNWMKVELDAQFTFSENNHNQSLGRTYGSGNLPVIPTDEGINLNTLELYVHKDAKGTSVLGYGPLPGEAPAKADWGYYVQAVGGRASGSLVGGFDKNWGINHRGSTDPSTTANVLIVPNAYATAYIPVLGGLNILGGLYGIGIGNEIHSNFRNSPNRFATHTYSLIADPDLALGGVVSGRLFNNSRGALGYEFGISSGIETVKSPNGTPAYQAALHYRTPSRKTFLDYAIFLANGEIRTGENVSNFPSTSWHGVISPRHQLYQYHCLTLTEEITSRWSVAGELTAGRQAGDGRADTIAVRTGEGGFKGAIWGNVAGSVTYKAKPSLWYSARYEHFRDGDGYELPPGVKSSYNAITAGVHYDLNKYMQLRPELRYDWQNAYRGAAFNSNRSHSQLTGTADLVVFF